jgi:hypothetical protein
VADYSLYIIIPIAIAMRIWFSLGGWPEAYWRIFRKEYFAAFIREPDGKKKRWVIRSNRIQSHSPATFSFDWRTGKFDGDGAGEYLIETDKQSRSNGRPAWDYNYNDARPIPQETDQERCDPGTVHRAIHNAVIKDIHREGQKKKKRGGVWIALIVISIIGLIGYYSWYLHDLQCKAGHC